MALIFHINTASHRPYSLYESNVDPHTVYAPIVNKKLFKALKNLRKDLITL